MKINILHPNEKYNYYFTIECFINNVDESVVYAIGYNHQHKQYTALGIHKKDKQYYFYFVKQSKPSDYKKIINSKPGTKCMLLSDITKGLWMPEYYIKTSEENTEKIFSQLEKSENKYKTITKTPMRFL